MKKIMQFIKKNRAISAFILIVALIPMLAVGCSLGGSSSTPTPTPTTQSATAQIMANLSRIDGSLSSVLTRLTSVETSTSGVPTMSARLTAVEGQVGAINVSNINSCLTIIQSQIAQLQADLVVANNRIVALMNASAGATPTPTPTPIGATPTPSTSGLVVTVIPLFSGAVKDANTYSYTFSVKNNFTSAKTFNLVADYSSNTMSANVNTSATTITSAEVISGFTKLFSPSTGNGCGLIRFTSSDLVIPAGGTLNINAEFTLTYSAGSPTTVWTCGITAQQ